jgi:hypothetical protein
MRIGRGLFLFTVAGVVVAALANNATGLKSDAGNDVTYGDLVGGAFDRLTDTQPAQSSTSKRATAAATPSQRRWPTVTARAFNLIQPGGTTTYGFIASLYGPGELDASSNVVGIKTESYTWKNPDGSLMSLMFQDEHLIVKVQNGLK